MATCASPAEAAVATYHREAERQTLAEEVREFQHEHATIAGIPLLRDAFHLPPHPAAPIHGFCTRIPEERMGTGQLVQRFPIVQQE